MGKPGGGWLGTVKHVGVLRAMTGKGTAVTAADGIICGFLFFNSWFYLEIRLTLATQCGILVRVHIHVSPYILKCLPSFSYIKVAGSSVRSPRY